MNGYRLFDCEEGDWFVMAFRAATGAIEVLYEGHSRAQALESALKHASVEVPVLTRDMTSGSYKPTVKDWK